MLEPISRLEVDTLKVCHQETLRRCVDLYLCYLDGHPVEEGADLEYVFSVVWSGNYRWLKGELGWATVLFVQTQFDLVMQMLSWRMRLLASRRRWRNTGEVVAQSLQCLARLAKILFRHHAPVHVPDIGLSDFTAVYRFTGQRGRP